MNTGRYRDLVVWKEGVGLVADVSTLSRSFPGDERFALCNQIQRASVSIPANIAEGHARASRKEFLHFLSIALGSLAELETHLIIAQKLTYLDEAAVKEMLGRTDILGKQIRSLQKALRHKAVE